MLTPFIALLNKYTWLAICVMSGLFIAQQAQAASFDCAKASSRVEHLICDNPDISKLDDELGKAYSQVLEHSADKPKATKEQRRWLKEVRNGCQVADCLNSAYRNRISELIVTHDVAGAPAQPKTTPRVSPKKMASPDLAHKGTYILAMSKNDDTCNHMLRLMNDDLEKFGRTYDSNDRFVSSHEEFNAVPWKPARASFVNSGRTFYTENLEGALFDLNNDGVVDFVVRDKSMLSGMRADVIYVLDASVEKRANNLTTVELSASKKHIQFAGDGYPLSLSSLSRQFGMLWLLSPFMYHGVSYLYMQSLYKNDEVIGGDYVVIAKYIGGKFAPREMTGNMEDICYIERVDVK